MRKVKPRRGAQADPDAPPNSIWTYQQRYYRRRKREQKALDARCARLAGPVIVTRLPRTVGGEQPVRASSADA